MQIPLHLQHSQEACAGASWRWVLAPVPSCSPAIQTPEFNLSHTMCLYPVCLWCSDLSVTHVLPPSASLFLQVLEPTAPTRPALGSCITLTVTELPRPSRSSVPTYLTAALLPLAFKWQWKAGCFETFLWLIRGLVLSPRHWQFIINKRQHHCGPFRPGWVTNRPTLTTTYYQPIRGECAYYRNPSFQRDGLVFHLFLYVYPAFSWGYADYTHGRL